MFKLDPNASYMMPAHFGSSTLDQRASGWYRDVTMMVVSFVTDREKLAAYLPEPFEVAELPIVTVAYACNRQVDWLAGYGYNMISVTAASVYNGEQEKLEGDFSLVVWENLTDPILTGRELQGIPKIYADIEDHSIIADEWNSSASHFGHKFLDINITDLSPSTAEEAEAYASLREGKDNPMGWRYLPGVSGFGQAISEPTTFPSAMNISEAFVGTGKVEWQQMKWEQNPTQHHIINALADLPVLAYLPAIVAKGSINLILPDNMPRVLG